MNALFKAKLLKNSPTDIRNFRDKYKFLYGESELVLDSPLLSGVQKYLQMLKEQSKRVRMSKRYYMRPEYAAYDFYGTTNLGFLILYANNCFSALDFTMDEFIVPDNDVVSFVLSKSKEYIKEVVING